MQTLQYLDLNTYHFWRRKKQALRPQPGIVRWLASLRNIQVSKFMAASCLVFACLVLWNLIELRIQIVIFVPLSADLNGTSTEPHRVSYTKIAMLVPLSEDLNGTSTEPHRDFI